MVASKYLDELLLRYDNYHSSIRYGSKIEVNINYKKNNLVELTLNKIKNNRKIGRLVYSFSCDFNYRSYIFPRFFEHFFAKSKNFSFENLKEENKNIISTVNGDITLTFKNCPKEDLELVSYIYSMIDLSRKIYNPIEINIENLMKEKIKNYVYCNIAIDYGKYRANFIGSNEFSNIFDLYTRKSYLKGYNRTNDEIGFNLTVLNVARLAYDLNVANTKLNGKNAVWDEIKEKYKKDSLIKKICDEFKNLQEDRNTLYNEALVCVEFEKNNEEFIVSHERLINEILDAVLCGAIDGFGNFIEYFDKKRMYYKNINDSEREKICSDIIESYRLVLNDVELERNKLKKDFVYNKEKNDKDKKKNKSNEYDRLVSLAEEQARQLMDVLNEREQIKRDADEFAKIILKEQREHKRLLQDADEQAQKIFELQKENELLKVLAQDNARSIFEKERKSLLNDAQDTAKYLLEESKKHGINLKNFNNGRPISIADVDKINNLLNALSRVKELDFAVNHPTVMQEIIDLEDKIISYLSVHKIVSKKQEELKKSEESFFDEKESKEELLDAIKSVYMTSLAYEKDGRHTVMEIVPLSKKYRVTIYSSKDDDNDILTEVYFDKADFTEDIIKEICNVFKENSVIVASKVDNIPGGFSDYLVIDNQDNAIRFMECERDLINTAKLYL